MKRLYLETFGCQMNVLDSQLVSDALRAAGYQPTDQRDDADVVLFNTCSVRDHAEQKVWSRLGELREDKKQRPDLVIGVIGCMAERDAKNITARYPHVDILCGPGELDKLPAMVLNAVSTGPGRRRQAALMGGNVRRSATLAAAEDNLEMLDLSRSISLSEDAFSAYVRITRGCDKFCSFCVVPYTRGPEVHRPPSNIIDEVKRLADAGALEVTLLGQTINHYAYRHGDGRTTSFADLLRAVHEAVPHLPRLRFVTSFPRDFTTDALQAMRDSPRICRYLHIPAQHGHDRLLRLMNRGYTIAAYYDLIDRARELMPDISLASDFIVGFPTETDDEFNTCAQVIRRCRFKNSFIFKYSPRPGTAAHSRLPDDVPDDVKRRRNNELLAVQCEVSAANNQAMIGREVELLIEAETPLSSRRPAAAIELGWERRQPAPANPVRQWIGRTRGDQVVAVESADNLLGRLRPARITAAHQMTLFAELIVTCQPAVAGA